MDWREEAVRLYFEEQQKPAAIARLIGQDKSRVARYLKDYDYSGYQQVKAQIQEKQDQSSSKITREEIEQLRQTQQQDAMYISHDGMRQGNPYLPLIEKGYLESAYRKRKDGYHRKEKTDRGALVCTSLPKVIRIECPRSEQQDQRIYAANLLK